MRSVKPETRILGVDDASFEFSDDTTELIGTVYRGSRHLEGVLKKDITVDGFDVTDTIIEMVQESRHSDQIQVVMLDGITFGGFNVADIARINEETGTGVIAVSRNKPDLERMKNGLKHVEDPGRRLATIQETGDAQEYETDQGMLYYQHAGVTDVKARELLKVSRDRSIIPEPVRAAHMIAGAIKNGESKGRV